MRSRQYPFRNGRISVVARIPIVRHSAYAEIERNQTPKSDDLNTWRSKLLGQPESKAAAFTNEAQMATVDLLARESIRKQIDALLTEIGRAALRCRVPESLVGSQRDAHTAAAEADEARAGILKAKHAMDASLHDPAMFQQGAVVSQAEQAAQQALVRADSLCLVLGRQCVEACFKPLGAREKFGEIAQLLERMEHLL